MGLDITAYSKLVKADDIVAFDDEGEFTYFDGLVQVFINSEFPGMANNLENGKAYYYGDFFSFHAGSYSAYKSWLAMLAEIADSGSFAELLNFSHCQGFIGSALSAKLAKDFADFQSLADKQSNDFFKEKYAAWRKAFDLASDNGAVEFY